MRSNFDRSQRVQSLFDDFVEKNRSAGEDAETNVADLICDLLHLLDQKTSGGLTCVNAARMGIANFVSEQHDQTGMGPDALVAIDVYIDGDTFKARAGDKVIPGGLS